MDSLLISVIICTYNRANILKTAIESLAEQSLDSSLFEVIIVNNNSTDHTERIARKYHSKFLNYRLIFEKKQGLSHARNRGWKEAKGQYIGYLDDDGKASNEWLMIAKKTIETLSPDVFGGPYYAFYNAPPPKWWKNSYRSMKHAGKARNLNDKQYLSGGNIFFKKTILIKFGGFNPFLGMSGDKIAFGEETKLIDDIRKNIVNAIIYYNPELFIYHLVHKSKMKLRWLTKLWFKQGVYNHILNNSYSKITSKKILVQKIVFKFFRILFELFYSIFFRNKKKYPYIQNYIFERISHHFKKIGALCEQWS